MYRTLLLILFLSTQAKSASLLERSYEYVMNLGKSLAPSLLSMMDCFGEDDVWGCVRDRSGKVLDSWDQEVQKQRRIWQEAADAEVANSGRSFEEMPSKIGQEIEESLGSIAVMINNGMARALSRKHHDDGGIDSITISANTSDKKKMKKKKKKPAIHLVHPVMMVKHQEKGRSFGKVQSWVIGDKVDERTEKNNVESTPVVNFRKGRGFDEKHDEEADKASPIDDKIDVATTVDDKIYVATPINDKLGENSEKSVESGVVASVIDSRLVSEDKIGVDVPVDHLRKGRGLLEDLWLAGQDVLDDAAEHALESDKSEDGVEDKSSLQEQRGKKKKKKKAILKLLILGAVLKAKIGTILQILSFKLQVKFFIIALLGLGINLARLWIDIKNKHNHQPQKVIYYEHAQHQHHYDHEEDSHGWGPWSRSMDPEVDSDIEIDVDRTNTPFRAQERPATVYRPLLTKD